MNRGSVGVGSLKGIYNGRDIPGGTCEVHVNLPRIGYKEREKKTKKRYRGQW